MGDFAALGEQLACTRLFALRDGYAVSAVYRRVQQPELVAFDDYIGALELTMAHAQRFCLAPSQRNAHQQTITELVIVAGPPVRNLLWLAFYGTFFLLHNIGIVPERYRLAKYLDKTHTEWNDRNMSTGQLLHPEAFQGLYGERQMNALRDEVAFFASTVVTNAVETPDISVVVQSYDDTPAQLHRLFDDLEQQEYRGGVQPIVVIAGNNLETLNAAMDRRAIVAHVTPGPGLRADVLNRGLEVADNKYVFTTVGHAALSNSQVLRAAAYQITNEGVGGVFGVVLPDKNASVFERLGSHFLGATEILEGGQPVSMKRGGLGMLAADCSIVNRDAALELGYPKLFGAGGADGQLGEKMLDGGLSVIRDPVMAVHHTHGLGVADSVRQLRAWRRMAQSRDYNPTEWKWHPNGGF